MVGALLLLQYLLILAMLHPLQLLRRRLSLAADDVTGYRVVNVVLCNKVYDDIPNFIGPIFQVIFPFSKWNLCLNIFLRFLDYSRLGV